MRWMPALCRFFGLTAMGELTHTIIATTFDFMNGLVITFYPAPREWNPSDTHDDIYFGVLSLGTTMTIDIDGGLTGQADISSGGDLRNFFDHDRENVTITHVFDTIGNSRLRFWIHGFPHGGYFEEWNGVFHIETSR